MSSHAKDPLQKQDTSSESSDTPSDSEIDEAEDNLGHLKIEESSSKEIKKGDSDESKPLDSPNQEGTLTSKLDLLNEPIAGPSGLQAPRLESSDGSSDSGCKAEALKDPQQKKSKAIGIEDIGTEDVEGKGIHKNIEARMEEGDSSSPLTGVTPMSVSQDVAQSAGPSVFRGDFDVLKHPLREVVSRFMGPLPRRSSSLRRYDYATDSANTSADVSEIRTESYDRSREGSVYHDAREDFEKEESPSYVTAVERQQSSENSDTNASEIQDFVPPLSEGSSASMSTPSGEQGNRAYLDQLQREADARGEPMSTSSGIGSTNQSELAKYQGWNLAGEMGYYRHDDDDPNQDLSENLAEGGQQLPMSEPMEDEPIPVDQQMQDFDKLFEQAQGVENREEMHMPEDEIGASAPRLQPERSVKVSEVGAGSPYKRRRPSKPKSDVSISEKEDIEKPRPKYKPDAGKKSKMVTSKSCPALRPSSESPEPKSSSSDELHRKESPEIRSETPEVLESDTSRKSYKTRGALRRMQYPAMSSQDFVIVEEEEGGTSASRQEDPGLMETEDPTSKVQTTLEKASEGPAETSEAKPSTVSSDQAYGSEVEGALKEHEQSSEDVEFQRSVGKSKREPKLSNSPPSDEKPDSAQKAATSRPKKRARPEKMPGKTRRTRHDSGGNVPKSVSLGNIQRRESASSPDVSDYTPSDDEKDTQS